MSLFNFEHKRNVISEGYEPTVFFLNEAHNIVPEIESKKFVVKKKMPGRGFKEFFGVIKNPLHKFGSGIPVPKLPFLEEYEEDAFDLYGLNKDKILTIDGKNIPIYFMQDFLVLTPKKFGGVGRIVDQVAEHAEKRRNMIYGYYQTLEQRFVKSLTEVNCSSVAYLYTYLNNGEQWEDGMEFYGYVDGLWETGSFLTVSVDTTSFDVSTAVHELGHSVSYYLVQEMFDEWYAIAIDTTEAPPTEYGMVECSEDFAESFKFHFASKLSRQDLIKRCPKRAAYMDKLDKMSGSALLSVLESNNELTERFSQYDKVVYNK